MVEIHGTRVVADERTSPAPQGTQGRRAKLVDFSAGNVSYDAARSMYCERCVRRTPHPVPVGLTVS
jgi:hypothetical protein